MKTSKKIEIVFAVGFLVVLAFFQTPMMYLVTIEGGGGGGGGGCTKNYGDCTAPVASYSISPFYNGHTNYVGNSFSVTGTASDVDGGVGINFADLFVDSTYIGRYYPDANGVSHISASGSWSSSWAYGESHTILVRTVDYNSNWGYYYKTIYKADVTQPSAVNLNVPLDVTAKNYVYGYDHISANPTDSGSGIKNVDFYLGSSLIKSVSSSPYSFDYDFSSYSEGTYTITAKAYDNFGNMNSQGKTIVVKHGTTNTENFENLDTPLVANAYSVEGWQISDGSQWAISTSQTYTGSKSLQATGTNINNVAGWGFRSDFADGVISDYYYPTVNSLQGVLGLRTQGCNFQSTSNLLSSSCSGYFLKIEYSSGINVMSLYLDNAGSWTKLENSIQISSIAYTWWMLILQIKNNNIYAKVIDTYTGQAYTMQHDISSDNSILNQPGAAMFGTRMGWSAYIDDVKVSQYDLMSTTGLITLNSGSSLSTISIDASSSLSIDFFDDPNFNGNTNAAGCVIDATTDNCPLGPNQDWQVEASSASVTSNYQTTYYDSFSNPIHTDSKRSLELTANSGDVMISHTFTSDQLSNLNSNDAEFEVHFKNLNSQNDIVRLSLVKDTNTVLYSSDWTAGLPVDQNLDGWTSVSLIVPHQTFSGTNVRLRIEAKNVDQASSTKVAVAIDTALITYVSVQSYLLVDGGHYSGIATVTTKYYYYNAHFSVSQSITFLAFNNYKLTADSVVINPSSQSDISNIFSTEANNANFVLDNIQNQGNPIETNTGLAIGKKITEKIADHIVEKGSEVIGSAIGGILGSAIPGAGTAAGFVVGAAIGYAIGQAIDSTFQYLTDKSTDTNQWWYGDYYGKANSNLIPSDYITFNSNEEYMNWDVPSGKTGSLSLTPALNLVIPNEFTTAGSASGGGAFTTLVGSNINFFPSVVVINWS